MKKPNSRQQRTPFKSRKRVRRQRQLRRAEALETRAMLAGDLMSPWHNGAMPADVNADGEVSQLDVQILASELKTGGARSLLNPQQRFGLEAEQAIYLDVNNDGIFNSVDVLNSVNSLILEGEPASSDFQATFDFRILRENGDILALNGQTAEVEVGETFRLQVRVQDTSSGGATGFTQAFIDIGFESDLVTVQNVEHGDLSSIPTNFESNVIEEDRLVSMGGISGGSVAVGADGSFITVVDITFQATAEGQFDFTTLFQDYPFDGDPNGPQIVAFDDTDNDGNQTAGENLVATYIAGAGEDDEPFDIVNFVGGAVSVNVVVNDPEAIADQYEIGEDFDPAAADVNPSVGTPPVVTIEGVQYAVLDVLANDLDEDDNTVAGPRSQFSIQSYDDLGGRVTLVTDTQSVPELAGINNISEQVLLYQVPDNFSSPPVETINYTMLDSESGESDSATVTITINPVDDPPLAEDTLLTAAGGQTITFDVMSLASLQGGTSENETLSFVEFVGEENLGGSFVPVQDGNGNETGEFTYTAPIAGENVTFEYVVSDGTQTATGQITIISLEYQTTFEFRIVDEDGNVIAENGETANIGLGDNFRLQVFVRDTSEIATGFTQAFVDIGFDSDYVTIPNPGTAVDHGPLLSDVPDGSFPTNVIPYGTRYADHQQQDTLLWMGGIAPFSATPDNDEPVLLVDIDFLATAEGTFDFTTLRSDFPYNQISNDDLIVAFNNVDNDGNVTAGENLVATYLEGAGGAGDAFDVLNFIDGMVSVNIVSDVPDAIADAYEVGEDFDPSAGDESPTLDTPPLVVIDGVQYFVLDVLANDLDPNGNTVAAPRSQFSIDTVTNNLGGRIEIQRNAQSIPQLAAISGLSEEVLLYRVADNFSSPPVETFSYTMTDSTTGESASASVSITVNPVDDPPLANDATLPVQQGQTLTFDVLSLASLQGGASENETLTFVEFVGTDNLAGTFVPVEDGNGNPTGEFMYTPAAGVDSESFQYVVSDGGSLTATAEITLISNSEDYQATFDFRIVDLDGNVLATNGQTADINLGQAFRLQVYVRDTSVVPSGFTQAFVDIGFDSDYVTVDNPNTAVDHGPQLSTVPDSSFPTNVIPFGNRYQEYQQEDTLLWMGGLASLGATPDDSGPVLLVDIEFRATAEGEFDFTTLRRDFPFNATPNDDLIVAFNNVDNEGNVAQGENLVATYLTGFGDDDEVFDVINFVDGMVSVDIEFVPTPGANIDSYEVGEDFDPSANDENPGLPTPEIVTIDGVQYAVLDVLANDRDQNANLVSAPRSQFSISSVSNNLGGRVTIQRNTQSIPELAAISGLSSEVLLYQVADNFSSPPTESFTYTMHNSVSGESDTAEVYITVNPVDDAPLAEDTTLTLEEGETITFDAMSLASLQGGDSENETLTFIEFVGEENLAGEFEAVLDSNGNPTGEFIYTAPEDGQVETLQYVVSDGGSQTAMGTITLRTRLNVLIEGVVYFDANNNGKVDDNLGNNASPEMRIGGVTVELIDAFGDVVETTTTDAFGTYSFAQFDAGTYSVRIDDPAFTRKGITSVGEFTLSGNEISGIEVGMGGSGEFTGLNFGYRGRDYAYIGRNDFLASNTENSLLLAFSKDGGEATLEWYSVDEGWDRLVQIRPIYAFMDPVTKNAQIAFEVTVEGQTEPRFVVQAFSTSTPGYAVVAETEAGMIVRVNGAASSVLQNLDEVDAYFANL